MSGSQGLHPRPDHLGLWCLWSPLGGFYSQGTMLLPQSLCSRKVRVLCLDLTEGQRQFVWVLFQSPGRPGHKQLRVELALELPGRLPFLMPPGAGLPWKKDIVSPLKDGIFSSCLDSASLSHITLGFSKEDGDLGIVFWGSPPTHICPAGLWRGSSDTGEGQPLSCHLVNWSSFMWAGAASAQGTAVGQVTLTVTPH